MKTAPQNQNHPYAVAAWALPMSMLPRVTAAKSRATAGSEKTKPSPNEAQLKMNTVENYGKQANFTFTFGQNGDLPIVGEWDGNGIDGVGFLRTANSTFNLSNGFQGTMDIKPFIFGGLGVKPIAGDWNGDGIATIGIFNPNTGTMSLNNTNNSGNGIGDIVFSFGLNGDVPLAGNWDGKPSLP